MSNFYCEDAYMDSTSYYNGDHSWDEQGYEVHQYAKPYYYEEAHSMAYDYEEPLPMPQYDMDYHYEQSFEMSEYEITNSYEDPNFSRRRQGYQDHNSYSRLDEKHARELTSSLVSMMAQLAASQAQQQKDTQLILAQIEELQAHNKMLEMLLAQQASSEAMDCFANVDSTTLESENIPDEPQHKDMEDSDDEDEYQEPPAYMPPIPFPQRLRKRIFEDQVGMNEDNMKLFAKADEKEESNQRSTPSSIIEHDKECIEENMKMEVATHQHIPTLEVHTFSFLKLMFDEELGDSTYIPTSDHNTILDGHIQLEDLEPPKYHDCVEISIDPSQEEPFLEVDKGSKEYVEDETPKFIIGNLKESALIKLEASVEDPFLPTIPQNKFLSFQPYISRSFEESSNNPLIHKKTKCKKGLKFQRKVNCRLDGREFTWDLKVD